MAIGSGDPDQAKLYMQMASVKTLTPEILVPRVGDYLVEKNLISHSDLKRALERQASLPKNEQPLLGQLLVEMGFLSREDLDQAITELILQLRNALQTANNELEERVRQRTAELQEALNKLSELDRLKSNFIANISHELRTPMTHIKGYLDLLLVEDLGTLEQEQKEALSVMENASNRLENLIEDLILFSSVEAGSLKLFLQDINLPELIKSSYERIVHKAVEKQIKIYLDCPQDLPTVLADRENLGWVIRQLLDNAIKFTQNNGIVHLRAVKYANGSVEISVRDNGIGIPPDRIKELFQPFHQLDGNSTRKYGGTGLGLALAQDIIKAHDSQIEVLSEPGKGSLFRFVLRSAAHDKTTHKSNNEEAPGMK